MRSFFKSMSIGTLFAVSILAASPSNADVCYNNNQPPTLWGTFSVEGNRTIRAFGTDWDRPNVYAPWTRWISYKYGGTTSRFLAPGERFTFDWAGKWHGYLIDWKRCVDNNGTVRVSPTGKTQYFGTFIAK